MHFRHTHLGASNHEAHAHHQRNTCSGTYHQATTPITTTVIKLASPLSACGWPLAFLLYFSACFHFRRIRRAGTNGRSLQTRAYASRLHTFTYPHINSVVMGELASRYVLGLQSITSCRTNTTEYQETLHNQTNA